MVDVSIPQLDLGLSELPKIYREAQQGARREQALEQLRANPNMGYDEAARLLIGGGDVQSGSVLGGLYNQIQQRAFQEKSLAEQRRHSQVTEGHQAATLEETRRNRGVTELQPVKLGTNLAGDVYGVRDPSAPGGYRIIDPGQLTTAGQQPVGSVAAPTAGPRPGGPIPSSPTVVGDAEGERSGLYPPSSAKPMTKADKAALTGDEFLKTVPAQFQGLIKKVANYEVAPTTFSNRGQREKILAAVSQYDPTYDETKYGSIALTRKRFDSGPQGNTLRSMNVGIDHLSTLQEYVDALHNGNVQVINSVKNKIKEQLGYEEPQNFNAVKAIVGSEISKAIVGSQGALADREEIKAGLKNANSPAQLAGVIKAFKKLMAGQVTGLKQQYDSAGLKDFHKRLVPATMKELGINEDGTTAPLETPGGSGGWQEISPGIRIREKK
jgi:hypothetical protein